MTAAASSEKTCVHCAAATQHAVRSYNWIRTGTTRQVWHAYSYATGDRICLSTQTELGVHKTVGKFRKKPIVIEAVQFPALAYDDHPFEFGDSPEWLERAVKGGVITATFKTDDYWRLLIKTLEGTMEAQHGDWIIRGVQGELYPCKPGIFAATYEEVLPSEADNA